MITELPLLAQWAIMIIICSIYYKYKYYNILKENNDLIKYIKSLETNHSECVKLVSK